MADDTEDIDLQSRLRAKADEIRDRLNVIHLIPIVEEAIDNLREHGGDDKTIAFLLRHAANELEGKK